jgi:glycosyltransferase involved in cell wall biosynthesis
MISNLAKKGIADFFAMAQRAAQQQLPIDFLLYGPQTPLLQQLMQQYPDMVQYCGYVAEPMQALAQLDAVVNLSHFAESFGRTLLEAMACKRLVLAYRFGAFADWLPPAYSVQAELGDWPALLAQLTLLLHDTEPLSLLLDDAARYAWQHYAPAQTLPLWQQLLAVSKK